MSLLAAGYDVTPQSAVGSQRTRSCWLTRCEPTVVTLHPIASDTAEAAAIKVPARAHQRGFWDRRSQINRLHSALREFSSAGLEAFGTDLAISTPLACSAGHPPPRWHRSIRRQAVSITSRS